MTDYSDPDWRNENDRESLNIHEEILRKVADDHVANRVIQKQLKKFRERDTNGKWKHTPDEETVFMVLELLKDVKRNWENVAGRFTRGTRKEFYDLVVASIENLDARIRIATWGPQVSLTEYSYGEFERKGETGGEGVLPEAELLRD